MKHISLATPEQVEAIKDRADILPGRTEIVQLNGNIAVIRMPVEINPVIWREGASDKERTQFIYSLEERLLGAGFDRYYCQIDAKDEKWQRIIEHWGFQKVSPVEEYRYLRLINNGNNN